jgi:hypothetical protein
MRPERLTDHIHTILHGSPEERARLEQRFFFIADTPDFMKALGLTGEYFDVRYGVISRHKGKDADHTLSVADWQHLCAHITSPAVITKRRNGYNIYIHTEKGSAYILVGVKVKSSGEACRVNAVRTVFERKQIRDDEVVYQAKNSPQQEALLGDTNFRP